MSDEVGDEHYWPLTFKPAEDWMEAYHCEDADDLADHLPTARLVGPDRRVWWVHHIAAMYHPPMGKSYYIEYTVADQFTSNTKSTDVDLPDLLSLRAHLFTLMLPQEVKDG